MHVCAILQIHNEHVLEVYILACEVYIHTANVSPDSI